MRPKRRYATPQRATAVDVDPANTGQASAWDGEEGGYWAAHAEQFDRAVAAYHERFLASADIASGALVLDIGCGTGQATRDAARAADGGMLVLPPRRASLTPASSRPTPRSIPFPPRCSMRRSPGPGRCSSATQMLPS